MLHSQTSNRSLVACALVAFTLATVAQTAAQKKISCPDGEHIEIDLRQISVKYDASGFAGTLRSLSALGGHLEVTPKKLQEVAAATQQWDEFLKGLAAGYNTCAVTRQQYADGLTRIYPRLKEDGSSLEQVRKEIAAGQKIETARLQRLIDSFSANLHQFAQISGKEIILERIAALAEQQRNDTERLSSQQKTETERILAKLDELKQANQQAPLATPSQVGQQISTLRQSLLAKADAAEAAYYRGYALADQYRFAQAVPYLKQAIADVPLPAFYLALGRAYYELSDLTNAESTIREGLQLKPVNDEDEAEFANQLGRISKARGDLNEALRYTQRALTIDEKVYGPDHPKVAARANNIGLILEGMGLLDEALQYAQRALAINEKVYGPDDPTVAVDMSNIGLILKDKGDLDGAIQYTQRALAIDEKKYGPDHPNVAIRANNLGQILLTKGDLDGALQYTQRALKIGEMVYGPDHPSVAAMTSNVGTTLSAKGDLDGALQYTQRALTITEKVYGPDHPNVAICANNIGQILKDRGDLDGALKYAQRAFTIDEKMYGPDYPGMATISNNIGQILQDKGDLNGALLYTQHAFIIDEKVYGPDHPALAIDANNIGQILYATGDLDGALQYTQRALAIDEKVYGSDNPATQLVANNLSKLSKLRNP